MFTNTTCTPQDEADSIVAILTSVKDNANTVDSCETIRRFINDNIKVHTPIDDISVWDSVLVWLSDKGMCTFRPIADSSDMYDIKYEIMQRVLVHFATYADMNKAMNGVIKDNMI